MRTAYQQKYEAPRQPEHTGGFGGEFRSEIHLFPHRNFEQALSDLRGFERIWVLFVFHKNYITAGKNNIAEYTPHNTTWKPKVLPPRGMTKRGVFATRAPYRPNPIGMSVLTLHEIQGLKLLVGESDILDGTPIFDIKPYIPQYDSFAESRTGWVQEEDEAQEEYTFEYSSVFARQMKFFTEFGTTFLPSVLRTLSINPYKHPYRRIEKLESDDGDKGSLYEIAHKRWRVYYRVSFRNSVIYLEKICSTYKPEDVEISEDGNNPHLEAIGESAEDMFLHSEFLQEWREYSTE